MVHAYKASINGTQFMLGVEIQCNVKHALELDKANGNMLWHDCIALELKGINEYQTFQCLEPGEKLGQDYSRIPYFIVFACKFDGRRKARPMANGSCTLVDSEEAYAGVVGMETVHLGFLLAEMNDLKVCAADISFAYLYTKTREKCYIIAGPKFRELEGEKLVIDRSLYGLCTSGAHFHEHLGQKLHCMGDTPSQTDPDFWIS